MIFGMRCKKKLKIYEIKKASKPEEGDNLEGFYIVVYLGGYMGRVNSACEVQMFLMMIILWCREQKHVHCSITTNTIEFVPFVSYEKWIIRF